MVLTVIVLDKKTQKFKPVIVKKSRRLAGFLPKRGSVEVYLVDDKRIQRLNKQFRGKNKPTNVLSFVKPKGFPGKELGEVYLGPLYIKRRKEDLDLMLVHGVLHILGYDHHRKNDRIRMQKKEAELLKRISMNNEE